MQRQRAPRLPRGGLCRPGRCRTATWRTPYWSAKAPPPERLRTGSGILGGRVTRRFRLTRGLGAVQQHGRPQVLLAETLRLPVRSGAYCGGWGKRKAEGTMRGSVIRCEGILERPFQRWGPGRARSGADGAGVARARDRRGLSAEPGGASCMVPCQPRGGVRRPRAELGEGVGLSFLAGS